MNWEAIGAIGEIAGAIAVVASLLYLATQIRMSNRIATRDSRKGLISAMSSVWSSAIENPSFSLVRTKLKDENSQLLPEELEQARDWAIGICIVLTAVGIEVEGHFLDKRVMVVHLRSWINLINDYPLIKPIVLHHITEIMELKPGYSFWWDAVLAELNKD